jgi:actin-related protein
VPVYDGYVLKKGVLHQSIGGNVLSQQIREHLNNQLQLNVTPLYKIASKKQVRQGQLPQLQLRNRPDTTTSFDDYQISVSLKDRNGTCDILMMGNYIYI